MSNRIPANGQLILNVPATRGVAVYSRSPVVVYQQQGQPNFPNAWVVLQRVAADTEYRSAAFAAGARLRIEAGASEALVAVGTSAVITERIGQRGQPNPGVLNATGTLTAAMIAAGIVTSTTAAAVTATLDTGAVMDAALDMQIGESFDWSAIATGANAFTVAAAASGHTLVGSGVVATVTSGVFRTRKTAAATFITYRLA
jgi:uncharacterized protein YaiE (UPF0345 family)